MPEDWISLDDAAEYFCPDDLWEEIEEVQNRFEQSQRLPRNSEEMKIFTEEHQYMSHQSMGTWGFLAAMWPLLNAGLNEYRLRMEIKAIERRALLEMLLEGDLIAVGYETEPTVSKSLAEIPYHIFENPKFMRPNTIWALGRKFEQVRVGLPEWHTSLDNEPARQSAPQKRKNAIYAALSEFMNTEEITENTIYKILCDKIRYKIGVKSATEKGYSDATIIRHFRDFLKNQKLKK